MRRLAADGPLHRLNALAPCALFLLMAGSSAGVGAAARAHATAVAVACLAVMIVAWAALAAWVLARDARLRAAEPRLGADDSWAAFERGFWRHVDTVREDARDNQ